VRVIAANQVPDHTTVARFRQRHQDALGGLFGEVLGLCAQAGLVGIAREILAEADAVDREEDERFGDRRGDELPEQLATGEGRAKWLAEAKRRLGSSVPRRPADPGLARATAAGVQASPGRGACARVSRQRGLGIGVACFVGLPTIAAVMGGLTVAACSTSPAASSFCAGSAPRSCPELGRRQFGDGALDE
jgi:hypothetical protein